MQKVVKKLIYIFFAYFEKYTDTEVEVCVRTFVTSLIWISLKSMKARFLKTCVVSIDKS